MPKHEALSEPQNEFSRVDIVVQDEAPGSTVASRPDATSERNVLVQRSLQTPVSLNSGDLRRISIDRTSSDNNLGKITLPERMDTLLSDISTYIKIQDEVTLLRITARERRQALANARADVAQADSHILDALHRDQPKGGKLALAEYATLKAASEATRNYLGPLEQEYADLELSLVSRETALVQKGRKIMKTYGQAGGVDVHTPPVPVVSLVEDHGETTTQFEFASTTIEDARASRASNDNDVWGSPVDQDRLLVDGNGHPHNRSNKRPMSHFATRPILDRQVSGHSESLEAGVDVIIDLVAPELRSDDDEGANTTRPELLYVRGSEAPLSLGTRTNSDEHMDALMSSAVQGQVDGKQVATLMTDRPHNSISLLFSRIFDQPFFESPGLEVQRWALHPSRKSVLDMLNCNEMQLEELDRILSLNEMDTTDDWILVPQFPNQGGKTGLPLTKRFPFVRAIWW